ncbi:MAG: RNA polymerase sigma factor RpoD/SigA [Saprospiraceae bacterium]|nr:sigma-70 family RNA polymerase sigma factor [Lewinella sp.]
MRQLTIVPSITSGTQDSRSLERYLSELKQIPLITAEEELQLARRIRAGDRLALDELVCANLRFVVSIAKQYQYSGLPLIDLISEGNIGLVLAAERFDATKGFKFISYAVWWIRKLILVAIREQVASIRLPINKSRDRIRLLEVIRVLEQELERTPTVLELSDRLELPEPWVQEIMRYTPRCTSLYAPLADEPDRDWLQVLADNEVPAPDNELTGIDAQRTEIKQLLARLPRREREIVRRCFCIGEGYDEADSSVEDAFDLIGQEVGLSGERVRVLKHRGVLKLSLLVRNKDV